MKKLKYPEQLCSLIFIWIGFAFTILGLLAFIGILKPSIQSIVQEPRVLGHIFFTVGITFLVIGIILGILASRKNKIYVQLIYHGIKTNGMVEKVYISKYMQYVNKSPYRVLYTYTYKGKEYHHKSHLLWEKPNVKPNDFIEIYINDSGQSAIQI